MTSLAEPLRAALLVHELGRSGGMGVLAGHVRALAADARFEPELVVCDHMAGELPAAWQGVAVRRLAAAEVDSYHLAVATWWTTALQLFDIEAGRRAVFLQSLEERFYRPDEPFERAGAASVLALDVDYVTVAEWIGDLLAELRPDARCLVVRNGIDKAVFGSRPRTPHDGRLRVLVEGQPTLWFKGVAEAVRAVRAMSEPASLTVVAHDGAALAGVDADRREAGLDAAGMAALYAEHDVLLKLSRVESVGMPPLEAFHMGVPCVLTPYTGHEQYARHGENCLIAGFDDEPGTTALLDLLARDRELLGRLSEGALATAAGWPSREDSGAAFADALAELARGERRGDAAGAGRRAARSQRLSIELGRHQLRHLRHALEARERELAAIKDERAYRLAGRLRRLLPGREG